jgi:hypothetical protein
MFEYIGYSVVGSPVGQGAMKTVVYCTHFAAVPSLPKPPERKYVCSIGRLINLSVLVFLIALLLQPAVAGL